MLQWLLFVAAAAVPEVEAGPDLADQARAVELPVAQVTVFSDRARVRREARVELKAGVQALRLPDLPGAAWLDTVRVELSRGKVLRIEAVPVERERFSIEQVDGYLQSFEKLADQRTLVDADLNAARQQLQLLNQAKPLTPVDERERVGKQPLPLQPADWTRVLSFFDSRRQQVRAELRKLGEQRRKLDEQIQTLQREIARHDLGAFSHQRIQVLALVQSPSAGKIPLALEYFVPGASWLPSYELHFAPTQQQVTLKTAAQVWQGSGEDWESVELEFSTAMPGRGIDLPELLTWTLGEQREWMPRPRALQRPAVARRYAAVQASETDGIRQARRAALQQRLAQLRQAMQTSPDGVASMFAADIPSPSLSSNAHAAKPAPRRSGRRAKRSRSARAEAPPPPMAQPSMAMDDMDMMAEMAPASEPEADSALGGLGQAAGALLSRSGKRERVRKTSLSLFEPQAYHAPRLTDRNLPAVLAGGLDYVYRAATPGDVPSDGQRVRVPLSSAIYPVKTFYEATPALAETAFLSATVTNPGERPILRGPVAIFVDHDFTGDGQLETTGQGGRIELPLGADEDIRIQRRIEPRTETKGLIGKREITTYKVTIEIGNYKKRAVELLVHDQIPRTHNEDMEVKLTGASPKLKRGPDAEGMLRWRLKIPAGKTRTIIFGYQVSRPENWQLFQR